jgi:UPF0271 protein
MKTLVVEPFGDGAWRVRLPEGCDVARRRRLLETLRALPYVIDAVVSEHHALAVVEPGTPRESLHQALAGASDEPSGARMRTGPAGVREPREHEIPVRYDGEDLADVARASGLSPDAVVAMHAACAYEVAMMGFLPGFAYLRSLPPRLVLPRRATPRTRVPALSVAIAGPYTGVYPFASPGGWHVLGEAAGFVPFDARTGAALALGDRVRFVPSRARNVTAPA